MVARAILSLSVRGLLLDDLVPLMHIRDDLIAAKDSLHLIQLMIIE